VKPADIAAARPLDRRIEESASMNFMGAFFFVIHVDASVQKPETESQNKLGRH
jgi:hypothetical protein